MAAAATVTSLFSRGGESDFTLVLVDGIRANSFGGGLDLSQVPLQDVERIEVLRGSQSALYGSDAIGGVVSVITRSGGKPSAQAQVEAGSRDMWRLAGATTGEVNGFRWQAGVNYFEDAGFTGTGTNGKNVSNDDSQASQAAGSIGYRHVSSGLISRPTCRPSIPSAARPARLDRIREPLHRPRHGVRGKTDRRGGGARWMQPGRRRQPRPPARRIDRADYDLNFKSAFGGLMATRSGRTRAPDDVAANAAFGLSGASNGRESGASRSLPRARPARFPSSAACWVFWRARWNASDRATVTAGVRGERISRDALPGPVASSRALTFRGKRSTRSPKIAAAFLAGEGTRLHGSFGTGIRPPDAFEIAFTDNSGLKPERSKSGELGVSQALAKGAVQIDGTAFINNYTDLIISVGRTFSGSSRWRTTTFPMRGRAERALRGVASLHRLRSRGTTRSRHGFSR